MRLDLHHHHHVDQATAEQIRQVHGRLDQIAKAMNSINQRMETIMINTKDALAAVQQQTTDNASLRTLLSQVSTKLSTVSQQLADAIAANDPAAMAAAQADLDQITQLANTDDAATKAAIQANTPADPNSGSTQGSSSGNQGPSTGDVGNSAGNQQANPAPASGDQSADQSQKAQPLAGTSDPTVQNPS